MEASEEKGKNRMIQKLTVPPADKDGLCAGCPFLSISDDYSHCTVRLEHDSKSYADARPGPECVPGEYALLPVAELAALRAEVEAQQALILAVRQHLWDDYPNNALHAIMEHLRARGLWTVTEDAHE